MAIRRVIFLFLFCLIFFSISASGYDNFVIHPGITSKAIEEYNNLNKTKLSSQEINWIVYGSVAEDADPRYLNHFFDPTTGRGLNDGFFSGKSAKEWAKKQNSVSGNYSESVIFDNYLKEDYARAYQGIGHILHLIQDMSVPAHTRNDAHPKGDPYEAWSKNNGKVGNNNKYIYVNNLDSVFESLASFTNKNFLSIDTTGSIDISKFTIEKRVVRNKNRFYLKNSIDDNIFFYAYTSNIDSLIPVVKIDDDEIIPQDYWNMLHSKAIGYSAGVIDYFIREFDEIDKERKKASLLELFKERFKVVWNNYSYVFGDAIIATHKIKNTFDKGYEGFYQYANKVSGGRVLGAITTDDLFMPKGAGADEGGSITPVAQVAESVPVIVTPPKPSIPEPKKEPVPVITPKSAPANTPTPTEKSLPDLEPVQILEEEEPELEAPQTPLIPLPSTPTFLFVYSDVEAPAISISEGPSLVSTSTTANFLFSSPENDVSYKYRLDGGAWVDSSSSLVLTSVSEGSHTIEVTGSDNSGNESDAISYLWSVDSTGPIVIIYSLAPSYIDTGFDVSWFATLTGSNIKNYDLEYNLNSISWVNYLSATTSTSTVFSVSLSVDDEVEFRARATDELDNIGEWSGIASTTIISSNGIARHVVISEIQLSATSTKDEFIELYNPTDASINLNGYQLGKKSFSGKEYTLVRSFPNVPIESKSYFLITHPSDYTGDITSDLVYSNSSLPIAPDNTIILYSDGGNTVIDKVGFGSAIDFETNVYPSNPGDNDSLIRKASASSTLALLISGSEEWEGNGYDSNDNSYDFLSASSSPQNSYSATEPRAVAPIIPNKIINLSLVRGETTKTSIKLSLTTTSDNNKGAGAYYDLRYKVKSGNCDLNIDWNNATLVASSSLPVPSSNSGDIHELEITGLTLNTEYCFALKIFNSENYSVLSNQMSATTGKNDILVDSTSSTYSIWDNNLNWSHTVSGDNRLLVVPVSWKGKTYVINSIKYGSEDLTLAVEEIGANSGMRTSIYYLLNPPVGTDNIIIDFNVSTYCGASAISLNNVGTSNPISTTTSWYAGGSRINSTLDLGINGMMIDSFSLYGDSLTVVADNLQTEIFNQDIGDATFPLHAGSSYRNVASQGIYEMFWNVSASLTWSHAIVVINPL